MANSMYDASMLYRTLGVGAVSAVWRASGNGVLLSMATAKQSGLLMVANLIGQQVNLFNSYYWSDALMTSVLFSGANYFLEWKHCSVPYAMMYSAGMTIVGESLADIVNEGLMTRDAQAVMAKLEQGFVPTTLQMKYK